MFRSVMTKFAILSTVLTLTVGFTVVTTKTASATGTSDACLHYSNHEYEVCSAYLANSTLAVLVPYYTYTHSTNASVANYVSYRLDQRYNGQANSVIRSRVANWPRGSNDVAIPYITINSVSSSLGANTATLHTTESWRVVTESGNVLFVENNKSHTIVMNRVPSYVLHKWVVTNYN